MESINGWLDLCSGIGAGFPYAGIKLWGRSPDIFCEWDSYCQDILKLRYPGTEQLANIKLVNFISGIAIPDQPKIVTASPPCQPFSNDGKRRGADDHRNCFPDVLRAIAELQPDFAIIENVAGLLSCPYSPGDKPGSYFGFILDSLSSIGFDAEWQCLSSAHFGSPWSRERIIIVAIARSLELDWERATPWENQIRDTIAGIEPDLSTRSRGPGIPRSWLQSPSGLDESTGEENSARAGASPGAAVAERPQIGVASRDGTNRDRRAALGNALHWPVAAIGLKRVDYLSQLAAEYRITDQK
ncbi:MULTISPECIES: DNA cytosine methyltransferase [unclassified Microcoleus]|uniref:DNA cytosine methyltransferase n=1 Tax=unclassified Microcoleus TaxID=2642155 RepID=UPI00404079D7